MFINFKSLRLFQMFVIYTLDLLFWCFNNRNLFTFIYLYFISVRYKDLPFWYAKLRTRIRMSKTMTVILGCGIKPLWYVVIRSSQYFYEYRTSLLQLRSLNKIPLLSSLLFRYPTSTSNIGIYFINLY